MKRPVISRLLLATLLAGSLPVAITACPGTTGDGDGDGDGDTTGDGDGDGDTTGDGDGDGDGDGACPDGKENSNSVCDVQNPASGSYVPEGSEVSIRGAVATTDVFDITDTLNGFFISDDPPAPYGGVLVTMPADSGFTVARGDKVNVTATVTEFAGTTSTASETQLEVGTNGFVESTASGLTIAPISLSGLGAADDEKYEGVLISVADLTTSNPDVGGGRFEVTDGDGAVMAVGPSIFFYGSVTGETFSSMTGVLRYNTFAEGRFELSPRDAADIVSTGAQFESKSIRQLRDPTAEGYVSECPFNQDCDTYLLENMVVVSQTIVEASDSMAPYAPYLFGFYLADPNEVNENGELLPYSGILVNVAPGGNSVRDNDYSFGKVGDGPYVAPDDGNPADYPQIGDIVSVSGQSKPYFDMARVYDVVTLKKTGTVAPENMPKPAQLDAASAAQLKGGSPEYSAADYGPAARAAIAASPDVEKWEGVLVQLNDVVTTDPCWPVPYNPNGGDAADSFLRDFGYWLVSGDVEIGTEFLPYFDVWFGGYWAGLQGTDPQRVCENRLTLKCADSREADQTFESLIGIVNYSFSVHRLNPRMPEDIQPASLWADNVCPGDSSDAGVMDDAGTADGGM